MSKKLIFLATVFLSAFAICETTYAETRFEIFNCELVLADRFSMSFQNDGQLMIAGHQGDGTITIGRFSDAHWTTTTDNDKSITFGKFGALQTRTRFVSERNVKVVQVTDRHNVILFYGGAADHWESFLPNCDTQQGQPQSSKSSN